MNTTHSSYVTRLKVGIFTVLGLALIVGISVLVNHRPYWWRPCQLVKINVEDATGLKTKSPIRSLGIEIGYLKSVSLSETHVTLGICITAPVEVLPSTRAFIRGEGFLGDKFVELKPIKYLDSNPQPDKAGSGSEEDSKFINIDEYHQKSAFLERVLDWIEPQVWAEDSQPISMTQSSPPPLSVATTPPKRVGRGGREIPVGEEGEDIQHLVSRVDELVHQMSNLTDNIKQAINPEDLRRTMRQLNVTLQNASKTLAPEGGLNQTAQRTLAKLEDSIEQLRDLMTRVNKGEGSVGMLLNDPSYAQEIREAIRNLNGFLTKVGKVHFIVDIGAAQLTAYNGGRGWFQLGIWPQPDHYYLLGISSDPRGKISNTTVTTTAGGLTQTTQTQVTDQTGLLLTGMIGKVFFNRLDLSVGALYGDGAASASIYLGPTGFENRIQLRNDIYARNVVGSTVDDRVTLTVQPWSGLYLRAGIESFRAYPSNGQAIYFYGAGIRFDDDDIKLLFTLK